MTRRWKSRLLIVGPYLLIVAAMFGGFRQLETERHQDCLNQRDNRTVLREVVIEATNTTGTGGSFDLTRIPGFVDLDEPTQTYFRNLSAALSQAPPGDQRSLRDRLLPLVPPIEC